MLFPAGFVSRRYYLDRGAIALAVRGEGYKRWRAAYIPNIRNEKRAAFAGWPFTIWNIVILLSKMIGAMIMFYILDVFYKIKYFYNVCE